MKTVLFLILPFPSHYTAAFGFANEWKRKQYKVVFTGTNDLKELVENEDFEFYTFQYLIEYKIVTFKTFAGLFLRTIADKSFVKSRYREFYHSYLQVKKLVENYKPEKVFIDEHFAEYHFFFKKNKVETAILNTKLSTKKVKGIPPLNTLFKPNNSWYSLIFCEYLWIKEFVKLRNKEFIQKIAFGGKDDVYFWKRFCIKNRLKWQDEIATDHSFNRSIKTTETIILAPKELEFKFRKPQLNEQFFHVPMQKNEKKYQSERYLELIEKIKKYKKNPNFKVIYCSFGTLSIMELGKVIRFFERLSKVLSNEKEILLVISKGGLDIQLAIYENLVTIDYMPQIDFLKYCDLMINHGGLGTIKECYDAGVPMYILPMNKKSDNLGNAIRVEANELGLIGDLEKESERDIYKKIMYLKDLNTKQREFKNYHCFVFDK